MNYRVEEKGNELVIWTVLPALLFNYLKFKHILWVLSSTQKSYGICFFVLLLTFELYLDCRWYDPTVGAHSNFDWCSQCSSKEEVSSTKRFSWGCIQRNKEEGTGLCFLFYLTESLFCLPICALYWLRRVIASYSSSSSLSA